MISLSLSAKHWIGKTIVAAALIAAPAASFAGVFISVNIAPPALPVYTQPLCPAEGYIWTPGYWAWSDAGYYWVPGVWIQPPSVGVLWTPGYWGWGGGAYVFHPGYWGPHVGFYGGINYGFGYTGVGFAGGAWIGGHFSYNRAVSNINVTSFHNTYVQNVTVNNNTYVHTSFNGGTGGVPAQPTAQEQAAMHEQHIQPTAGQMSHQTAASQDRGQLASVNGGHPQMAAARNPEAYHNVAMAHATANPVTPADRQRAQQARVSQGVRSGQMTPGETKNVENRETSIHHQTQTDRAANNGHLTAQDKQQINQRQNNVSKSIAQDKHNANTDKAAAARNNKTAPQEKQAAKRTEKEDRPR
jgi:hypothetical protein